MIQEKYLLSLMLGDGGVVQAESHFACSLPSAGRRVLFPCAGTMPSDQAAQLGLESLGHKWFARCFKISPLAAFFRGKVATVPVRATDFYSISFKFTAYQRSPCWSQAIKVNSCCFCVPFSSPLML